MPESFAAVVNDLGDDCNSDLFGKNRADIETNRHVHTIEPVARNALLRELRCDRLDFRPAANHADVTRIGLNRPSEDMLVFFIVARDDDHIRVLVGMELRGRLLQCPAYDVFRFGETFGTDKFRTVVDDGGAKTGNGGDFGNLKSDVSRAEDD